MRQLRARRGATWAYVIVVLFVLIGFVGLALDWGYVFWTGQQLQNAADASSLAGAWRVFEGQPHARAAAINIAGLNLAARVPVGVADNPLNDPNGDVVCGIYSRSDRTFTPTIYPWEVANAVRVVARRDEGSIAGPLELFFSPIWANLRGAGKSTANVARSAIAMAEGGPDYPAVLSLNMQDPYSFYLFGNGRLDVGDEGAVQVNSSSNQAAVFQGTSLLFKHEDCNVVGEYDIKGRPDIQPIDEGQPVVYDPLSTLPEPEFGPPMNPPQINGDQLVYWPGYYPDGLDLQAGDIVTLMPGVYVLSNGSDNTGPAFATNGYALLSGQEVMFYIDQGSIIHNGTADVYLTPPADGVYEGIQFFQARDNTETAVFNGTGVMTSSPGDTTIGTGTFYFPSATVSLSGTGDMYLNRLIADKIRISGDGTKRVYEGYDSDEGTRAAYIVE